MRALATEFAVACGEGAQLYAAGHQRVYDATVGILAPLGFRVLNGGRGHNGADRQLLSQHRRLFRRGVRHFAVASCDGAFAVCAQRSSVTVFTLVPSLVSERLRRVAEELVVFHQQGDGFMARGPRSGGAPDQW